MRRLVLLATLVLLGVLAAGPALAFDWSLTAQGGLEFGSYQWLTPSHTYEAVATGCGVEVALTTDTAWGAKVSYLQLRERDFTTDGDPSPAGWDETGTYDRWELLGTYRVPLKSPRWSLLAAAGWTVPKHETRSDGTEAGESVYVETLDFSGFVAGLDAGWQATDKLAVQAQLRLAPGMTFDYAYYIDGDLDDTDEGTGSFGALNLKVSYQLQPRLSLEAGYRSEHLAYLYRNDEPDTNRSRTIATLTFGAKTTF